jgi:hypothetical protein
MSTFDQTLKMVMQTWATEMILYAVTSGENKYHGFLCGHDVSCFQHTVASRALTKRRFGSRVIRKKE